MTPASRSNAERSAVLAEVGTAVTAYLSEFHGQWNGPIEQRLGRLVDRLRAVTAGTDFEFRLVVESALESLAMLGDSLSHGPPPDSAGPGTLVPTDDPDLERVHAAYDRGERQLVWPPPADLDTDELTVVVTQFMERKARDWPRIAFADQPATMFVPPFTMAVRGALHFVAAWLAAPTRADLLEVCDAEHIDAWQEYLDLPQRPPRLAVLRANDG